MIKVLHVVSSLGGGGVESMVYNYYTKFDRQLIQFDFIVHGDDIGMLEEKFQVMGSKIFHVTPKKISFMQNVKEINYVIQNGRYDVVHCHQNFSNFVPLLIAKKYNVPVRISHAHGCKTVMTTRELIKNYYLRLLNKLGANYFFSCGVGAGKWLHGMHWFPNGRNIILKNAIDTDKFSYSPEVRKGYRRKLNLDDKIVLLHVGRFSEEKNHMFLLQLFHILSKHSKNYILLFVGNGPTEGVIRKQVNDYGLNDQVRFLGVRTDVAEIMNAADIFLLPSKHEGFAITLLEAQATGMIAFASDTIPRETAVTNLIKYIPIENPSVWVDEVIKVQFAD